MTQKYPSSYPIVKNLIGTGKYDDIQEWLLGMVCLLEPGPCSLQSQKSTSLFQQDSPERLTPRPPGGIPSKSSDGMLR